MSSSAVGSPPSNSSPLHTIFTLSPLAPTKTSFVCGIRLALFLTSRASSWLPRLFTSSSTSPLYAFITAFWCLFSIADVKQTFGRRADQMLFCLIRVLLPSLCCASATGYSRRISVHIFSYARLWMSLTTSESSASLSVSAL